MYIKWAHLLFWGFLVATLLVGGGIYFEKNQDSVTYYHVCVRSDGKPYDPRYGEGPECEEYGDVAEPEGKLRAFSRGVGVAIPFALALGFAGLWVGDKIDDRKKRVSEHEQDNDFDMLVERATALVKTKQKASTAMFQKELKINYITAARIMDRLEDSKIVGPSDGTNPRKVFV